jgi:hypothetical protein
MFEGFEECNHGKSAMTDGQIFMGRLWEIFEDQWKF